MTTKHSFINWKVCALLAICGATAFGLSICWLMTSSYLNQRVQRPIIGGVRTRLQCLRDLPGPDLVAPLYILGCLISPPKAPPSPVDPSVYPRRRREGVSGSETTTIGPDAAHRH